ncbi:AAA family ATPase [Intestinibacillus massiliensis]|nr:AAA family ATPase [Intestinibacillus massiliensis]
MRIDRIELYNISSYSGAHTLDFTVKGARNIILIGGQNGTGKTSLFTAIKLALYGPLCFRFQSKNNQYTARVKELISHDAFAQEKVRAYIEIGIELPRDGVMVQYTIRRAWAYEDQKLSEQDFVWENGKLLEDQELDFFQNYLYHVIPPNIFDFFFFDGEEIAGFFSSPSYRSYLKEAVLTLDHYDTFDLIQKFCRRYAVGEDEQVRAQQQREEYEAVCNELDQADTVRQERALRIGELEARWQQCIQERMDLESKFQKKGGILQGEQDILSKQLAVLERRRDQINLSLKSFVEEMDALVLTAPVAGRLRKQLALEQKMQQYRVVAAQLSPARMQDALSGLLPEFGVERGEEFIQSLSRVLTDSLKTGIDPEHFTFLHDLSQEQRDMVGEVLTRLERFQREGIVRQIEEKDSLNQKAAGIRKTLESAPSAEELRAYEEKIACLKEAEAQFQASLEAERQQEEEYAGKLERLEGRRKSLRVALVGATRRIDALQYTERINVMMQDMVSALLARKRREIEVETLRLSKEILRKEHFIDLIELDEQFGFALYRQQPYSFEELAALFSNIGADDLAHRIGTRGVSALLGYFQVDSVASLKKIFRREKGQATLYDGKTFALYKRIEFQQLSKGEKQIFILSLYWAIIKASGRDIPFVIDTPFARIDTEHREQIAEKMFPSISGQVIILSTDEEITPPYYSTLRPYIAQEYTLTYNEQAGQTEVSPGYSFGGSNA